MHPAIAPLVLCIGAALPSSVGAEKGLLSVSGGSGADFIFLGAFYYYGELDFAMKSADQNAMEWINGDNGWNPILFDARLFGCGFPQQFSAGAVDSSTSGFGPRHRMHRHGGA